MPDSLWPHWLQHASLPCPSPSPGACSNSCSLSWWCHPTISSSVIPFSYCLQSFPDQGLFQWVSSLHQVAKVLVLQPQHQSLQWRFRKWRFHLGMNGWISLQSKGLSRVFSNTIVQNHQFLGAQPSLWSNTYICTWLGNTITVTRQTFVSEVICLFLNMPSRFVIAFLPRSKHVLISWLQVTICNDFGVQENKGCHYFHCFSIYLPWSDGTGCHDLRFWMLSFKPTFSLSSFTFIKSL